MSNQYSKVLSSFESFLFKLTFILQKQFKVQFQQTGLYLFLFARYEIFIHHEISQKQQLGQQIYKHLIQKCVQQKNQNLDKQQQQKNGIQIFSNMISIRQSLKSQFLWLNGFTQILNQYNKILKNSNVLLWEQIDGLFYLVKYFLQFNYTKFQSNIQEVNSKLVKAVNIFKNYSHMLYGQYQKELLEQLKSKMVVFKTDNFEEKFCEQGIKLFENAKNIKESLNNYYQEMKSQEMKNKNKDGNKDGILTKIQKSESLLQEIKQQENNLYERILLISKNARTSILKRPDRSPIISEQQKGEGKKQEKSEGHKKKSIRVRKSTMPKGIEQKRVSANKSIYKI